MDAYQLSFLTGLLLGISLSVFLYLIYWNIKTYKAVKAMVAKYSKAIKLYEEEINRLPESEKQEIYKKARNSVELVEEAQAMPDSYYEDLGTTKQKHIEQIAKNHRNWLEANRYPVFEKFLEK